MLDGARRQCPTESRRPAVCNVWPRQRGGNCPRDARLPGNGRLLNSRRDGEPCLKYGCFLSSSNYRFITISYKKIKKTCYQTKEKYFSEQYVNNNKCSLSPFYRIYCLSWYPVYWKTCCSLTVTTKGKKVKVSVFIWRNFCSNSHSRRSGTDHTVLPANYTVPASTS